MSLPLIPPPPPPPLETNPTSAGLRVHSFTQNQARATMCSVASNNKHGMPRKMRVLHVEDYCVNQITITPFHGSSCTLQGSETSRTTQSTSVGTHWKILSFLYKKKNLIQFCSTPSYWSEHLSLFLFVWQAMISSNSSALGESSWFQLSETGLWTKPPVISLMDLTVHVRSAFFSHSQEIFYQPHSSAPGVM